MASMGHRIAALLAAAALTACGSSGAGVSGATPRERAVRVEVEGCGHASATFGSGVAFGAGRVVTAAHVVAQGSSFVVVDADGEAVDAAVVGYDGRLDLALLVVDGLDLADLPMSGADADSTGVVAGAVTGETHHEVIRPANVTIGEVLGTDRHSRTAYQLAVITDQGDSGAGVYDADGRLIGVVFATSTETDTTWATASTEIETFLATHEPAEHRCDVERSRLVATTAKPSG